MLDLRDISLFVAAAALGNLSAAGRRVGMSAATASRRLAAFEDVLGTRLLYRTTRSIALTADGEVFLRHAQRILKEMETARESLSAYRDTPRGTLRITAPISFGQAHIAPALPDFLSLYPDVNIDLILSESLLDLVDEGIDVAVRIAALADSRMMSRKLSGVRRVVCAAPSYLERRGRPLCLEDLKAHNCLVSSGRETWAFTRHGVRENVVVRGNVRSNDGVVVRDLALRGLGIVLRALWDVGPYLASGELKAVLPQYETATRADVWAVYPGGARPSPKVRAFIDYLTRRFGPVPYWEKNVPPDVGPEA
ncbi:LysR family transcriptional regulator [Varunaivibrio sulfuroxidans]|uniref:LysR family transcriptional regulator n=1 Tax=Varunaivibrio sulfuroxidans TaxID=1773489 RepID=A0A4R3J9N5_9PROT|nr:LysR family transcriptional regulator [Varunaivibrio sulfuroxidans]TCS61300.1 LysR family transcriptional regulator [Varunaivibrio sulfuroxidans]WES31084.1 LysR family transcriptional regulator [Varunaivibrio sulfuroxidans]